MPDALLLETGDFLLTEDGDHLLLEDTPVAAAPTFAFQVAPGATIWTVAGEGAGWIDVDVIASWSLQRGRTTEIEDIQPGRLSFSIFDTDRTWDPTNSTSPYFGQLVGAIPCRLTATYQDVDYSLFTGTIGSWPQSYDPNLDGQGVTVDIVAYDVLSTLARSSFAPVAPALAGSATAGTSVVYDAGYAAQLSGERVAEILTTAGVPANFQDVDAGLTPLVADLPGDATILPYLQRITKTELGRLWAHPDGIVTWRQRRALDASERTVQGVFYDSPGWGLPYTSLEYDPADIRLLRTTVERGSTVGTVSRTDPAAARRVGGAISDSDTGLLFADIGDATAQAEYLLARYAYAEPRITQLKFKPAKSPGYLWPAALGWDLFTRVNVTRTPGVGGTVFTQESIIEQISIDANGADVTVTYDLSQPDLDAYLTVGDPERGIVGSAFVLAY